MLISDHVDEIHVQIISRLLLDINPSSELGAGSPFDSSFLLAQGTRLKTKRRLIGVFLFFARGGLPRASFAKAKRVEWRQLSKIRTYLIESRATHFLRLADGWADVPAIREINVPTIRTKG